MRTAVLVASLCGLALTAAMAILAIAVLPSQGSGPDCRPVETFDEVRYKDFGPTSLVVTRPCADSAGTPYVVFANYMGAIDADYYTGKETAKSLLTPRDSHHFAFAWLAQALARAGIASVRYDPIAIRSRKREGNGFSGATVVEEDLLRVQRADFSGLLAQVVTRADALLGRPESTPVVFVGHSGGAFTVGDYLENQTRLKREQARQPRPYGFVGIAPAVSDATGALQARWRFWVRKASACLVRSTRTDCLEELRAHAFYSTVFHDPASRREIEEIFSSAPSEADLVVRLDDVLSRRARKWESDEYHRKDGIALLDGRYRFQQSLYHSMAFRSPSSVPLSCHTQAATLIFGGEDYLLEPAAEAQAWSQACGQPSDIIVLPERGHTLGQDPFFGPPSVDALEVVARSIRAVVDRLGRVPVTPGASNTSPPTSPNSSPPSTGTHR
jgi:hypothetical protein